VAEVTLEQVVKRFGRVEVLHGVDLAIPRGWLTVLLGPSGCGKSTLLRMIAGLEDVSAGHIRIDGNIVDHVDPARRGCAMVFQNYALYPHQTVYKNMAFPLRMAGRSRPEIDHRVREVAALLQVDELLDRLPRDLSGGQRQRVAMGRAMIREPKVFLFDEPLSNLDAELRVKMRLEISRLQRQLEATMVFVTHDQVEAMTLAHRIVVMNAGHIEQVGAPLDVYQCPRTRFVAGFIGSPSMNFFDLAAVESRNGQSRLTFKDGTNLVLNGTAPRDACTLGVRPEHVRLDRDQIRLEPDRYQDLGVEHLGDRSYRYLSLPFGELTMLRPVGESIGEGSLLCMGFETGQLHFFDARGKALSSGAKT
jgi:ABC-type sugar transport system ATPase subunit